MSNDQVITDDKTTTSTQPSTININYLKQNQNDFEVKIDSLKFKRFQLLSELEDVEKQLKPLIMKHKQVIKQIYIAESKVKVCPDYSRGKVKPISSIEEDKIVKRKKEIKTMNFEQMVKSAQVLSEFDKTRLLNCLKDLKDKLS